MRENKASTNKKSTTKCQRSDSGSSRISKLFSGLLLLALCKLALIGAIGLQAIPVDFIAPVSTELGPKAASAQAVNPSKPGQTGEATDPKAAEGDAAQQAMTEKGAKPLPSDWEALRRKQDELKQKEMTLKQLESEINAKLERMSKLEASMKKMLKEASDLKDKKLRHLIDVYANMKAKNAADALQRLDERTAVKILSGMRGRKAGEVLNFVEPARAARLSEALTDLRIPFEE